MSHPEIVLGSGPSTLPLNCELHFFTHFGFLPLETPLVWDRRFCGVPLSPFSSLLQRPLRLLASWSGRELQSSSEWPQSHWPRSRLSTVTAQSRILAALLAPQAQMQEAAFGMDRELLGSGPKSQPFPPDGAHGTALPLPWMSHLPWVCMAQRVFGVGSG